MVSTSPILHVATTLGPLAWLRMLPLLAIHVAAVVGLVVGGSWQVWVLAAVLYALRMFGITAGYHRYFSHRAFRTSRLGQFLLAVLAQSASQKGVLWWAQHHRRHHAHSDGAEDGHSPVRSGFWFAHLFWIYADDGGTDLGSVRDLARYPELRLLNTWWPVVPALLALGCFLAYGWPGLLIGFCLSTVCCWHATFCINSLAHCWGSRRYATADASRNNALLALLTFGEGWHNNHHYAPGAARQGFFWWEIDCTWYCLRLLAACGLISELRPPPARVNAEAA
ncbi:MAG: acyl-CoA desaturase [Planctomycetota bacterium]